MSRTIASDERKTGKSFPKKSREPLDLHCDETLSETLLNSPEPSGTTADSSLISNKQKKQAELGRVTGSPAFPLPAQLQRPTSASSSTLSSTASGSVPDSLKLKESYFNLLQSAAAVKSAALLSAIHQAGTLISAVSGHSPLPASAAATSSGLISASGYLPFSTSASSAIVSSSQHSIMSSRAESSGTAPISHPAPMVGHPPGPGSTFYKGLHLPSVGSGVAKPASPASFKPVINAQQPKTVINLPPGFQLPRSGLNQAANTNSSIQQLATNSTVTDHNLTKYTLTVRTSRGPATTLLQVQQPPTTSGRVERTSASQNSGLFPISRILSPSVGAVGNIAQNTNPILAGNSNSLTNTTNNAVSSVQHQSMLHTNRTAPYLSGPPTVSVPLPPSAGGLIRPGASAPNPGNQMAVLPQMGANAPMAQGQGAPLINHYGGYGSRKGTIMGSPVHLMKQTVPTASPHTTPGGTRDQGGNSGGATTPIQSPRPGILRKRPSELTAGTGTGQTLVGLTNNGGMVSGTACGIGNSLGGPSSLPGPTGIPATRKLFSEGLDRPNSATGHETVSAGIRADTPAGMSQASEEGSNHSLASSSSTLSAGPNNGAAAGELSPRKRQRKQAFDNVGPAEKPKRLRRQTDLIGPEKGMRRGLHGGGHTKMKERRLHGVKGLKEKERRELASLIKQEPPSSYSDRPHSSSATSRLEFDDAASSGSSTLVGDEEELDQTMMSDAEIDGRNSITPPVFAWWRERQAESRAETACSSEINAESEKACSSRAVDAAPCDGKFEKVTERGKAVSKVVLDDREGHKNQPVYRPRPCLLATYSLNWHPRKNHFKRPELVRLKSAATGPNSSPAAVANNSCSPKSVGEPDFADSSSPLSGNQVLQKKFGRAALRDAYGNVTGTVTGVSRMANDKDTWRRLSAWKIKLFLEQLESVALVEKGNLDELNEWVDIWDADKASNSEASASLLEKPSTNDNNNALLNRITQRPTASRVKEKEKSINARPNINKTTSNTATTSSTPINSAPLPGDDNAQFFEKEYKEIREMALTCAQRSRALSEQMSELRERLLSSSMRHGGRVDKLLRKYASKRPVRSKRVAAKTAALRQDMAVKGDDNRSDGEESS